MHDLALRGERKALGGQGRARDVATQMLQTRTLPSLDLDRGVQTETVELGTQILELRSLAPVVCGGLTQAGDAGACGGAQCDSTLEGGGYQ